MDFIHIQHSYLADSEVLKSLPDANDDTWILQIAQFHNNLGTLLPKNHAYQSRLPVFCRSWVTIDFAAIYPSGARHHEGNLKENVSGHRGAAVLLPSFAIN